MPRQRDPKRDESFRIWIESNGTKLLKEIAAELGVADSQIRKWKSQDKWDEKRNGNVTKPKRSVTKQKGGQPGNKNAKGHGPPKQNTNAVIHGFFQKFLPSETLEIMESMQERSAADLIYDQIQIQYAAIIRAQQIMFVTGKDEMIKELKKAKYEYHDDSDGGFEKDVVEEEYEFQFAWDRHATFLTAQTRAMSELRNLIKQFNDMAHENDERRLKLEQMRLGIDKTKAEIDKLKSNDDNQKEKDVAAALRGLVDEINSEAD